MKIAIALFALGVVALGTCGNVIARGSHHGSHSPSSTHTYISPRASDSRTSGYTRRDGTYVHSYMHSAPDSTRLNNFSTKGNVNPYTGKVGTKDPNGH